MRLGRRPDRHLLLLRWERVGQEPRQIGKDHHSRHNVLGQVLVLYFVGPDLVPHALDIREAHLVLLEQQFQGVQHA